ncbi:MAG: carboxypeptidase regulatory-like domain-containing protein [Acidobacteriota bacterium]|nr:carboxypeptidase regulatory-like domain-containing protein [Acidobacteriota bacterium]
MRAASLKFTGIVGMFLSAAMLTFFSAFAIFAQSNAADLTGTVTDQNGAVVAGATVTARNPATAFSRSVTASDEGVYQLIGLPPDEYEITAEAPTFKKTVISPVKLTVGQSAELRIQLEVGAQDIIVTVSGTSVDLVETTKTSVSNTIDQERIENLPINERSATGFALTISTVGRDNGRPVGPAPTSGLNIGGQRGRSTLVQVDGADFTDNSVNAARSTVSQEAVQEYQVTTNSYAPEFGRATGGIVNVVTKSGTNRFSGNVFGFIRHKSIQSRNAFAPVIDGDPNKKPPYTRVQYGFTFGGPVIKDRAFFFYSFEQRRRQESGFFTGDIIGRDASGRATSSVTIGAPFLPVAQTFTNLTPGQAAYIQSTLPTNPSVALAYAYFTSVGGQTAQNGASTLVNFLPGIGIPQGSVVGQRFLLSGRPVPLTRNGDGQFVAFRPLSQLARIFPISEGTTFNSLRYDHLITENNQMSLRLGYNPSRISGIQDESQNQTLGQNDYSRTGIQVIDDVSFSASLASVLPRNLINEAYFSFGKRDATFDSQVPSVAHQIAGTGFIGSNPFSPVDRTETRFQIRDNMTWATGNHTIKFGADFNWINVDAKFELNFPGLFNFGQQSCGSLITGCTGPAFTPIQAYGLGFPSVFIQGFGDPGSQVRNRPIAFFAQDTWKMFKNVTVNYGVRYDVELTEEFAPTPFRDPLTGITLSAQDVQTAQDALNVTQGFPRDNNNIAPRLGAAWDVTGDGKTVIRGAIGMFYDHPLLAVAFNSDVADGSQQQQSTLLPIGGPSPTGIFNAFQVFHGTAIPGVTPGLAASAQYLQGFQRFNPNTFTGFGPILPFTLHVGKDFEYPYAIQGNLAIERQLGRNTIVSASYITVNARHLAHPQDVNNVQSNLLVDNFRRFAGRAPNNLTEAAFFSLPTSCTPTTCPPGFTVVVPGFIGRNGLGQTVVSPIAANFFRRLGPNYFFVKALTGLDKPVFDSLLAGSLRTPGPINSYADVNAQLSDGNSSYNAMNLEMKKRFSTNIQFLASYTWSHSIDDSSDLQTLLKPQDNTNFRAERSDSLFDQRHRFVFSGVISSPENWRSGDGYRRFLSDFTIAPIIELSSGRPFNILTVNDANGDFQSSNERPSVLPDGTLCSNLVDCPAGFSTFPVSGNLGRNRGITHNYFSLDMRLTRRIRFGERVSLDLIAEGFNLFNRFNEAAANPFYQVVNAFGERSKGGKYFSEPTSAFDPRQFQFGMKFNF